MDTRLGRMEMNLASLNINSGIQITQSVLDALIEDLKRKGEEDEAREGVITKIRKLLT